MRDYHLESLSHDPIHGYIPFTSSSALPAGEVAEQQIIDHRWLQRLRHIRQLQTAWWVYPSAEHTRFQHVIGVMHLASRAVDSLYESLTEVCEDCPSRGYIESLLRLAGLLHDVGHGPFGHFFDEHVLRQFGETHETIGARIIVSELGDLLRRVRRNPNSCLEPDEEMDPSQIAWLITRPQDDEGGGEKGRQPQWLRFLRSLLSGIYTIDNMDFVLRDAYMSGYSLRAYDLDRLLHYSFFTDRGLTILERGVDALLRFLGVKAELFRSIYFHRTVRAIDLTLADLFPASKARLLPGNPAEHLNFYRDFTESSLLVDVRRWAGSADPEEKELGERWSMVLDRRIPWKMVCQRSLVFSEQDGERSSIFSDPDFVEQKLRAQLPPDIRELPLRVDIARHISRPHTRGPSAGQNFLYDPAHSRIRELTAYELYRRLPVSHRICRIYAESKQHGQQIAMALDELVGGAGADDLTNM